MNQRFQDQVAVITGAGIGIGYEIARQLTREGASVVLNDIDSQRASEAASQIQKEGGRCVSFAGDVSVVDVVYQLVELAIEKFGSLDIAIANAGLSHFGNFFTYPQEDFQRVVNINLGGSFFLAQAAANYMRNHGVKGRILFMSSVTGHQAHPNLVIYGATKAGLEMMAKSLVIDLSPYGITVNALAPGATVTERTLRDDPNYESVWSELTPTGRPCTTQDIAHAAMFLVSPLASQITGQSLIIDGGWTSISPSPPL